VLPASRFFAAPACREAATCLRFAATRLKFAARLKRSNKFGRRLTDYPP
jgi:hypothetical protein